MIEVVMFTKNNCPNCSRADMLFQFCPVKIELIKKNVDEHPKVRKMLDDRGIMSLPSFVINGIWIEGFNEGKIKEELGL